MIFVVSAVISAIVMLFALIFPMEFDKEQKTVEKLCFVLFMLSGITLLISVYAACKIFL